MRGLTLFPSKASDTLRRADIDMHLANIRHIPVVDEKGNLIGILSDRNILRAVGGTASEDDELGNDFVIGEIMTRDVRTVSKETPAFKAAEIMIEQKIGALPVTGEDGQLIGMVTETDYLGIAYEALVGARHGQE